MIEQIISTRADVPGVGPCWLTESVTGTFWLTDRDKALKPGLSRLKRDVWYASTRVLRGFCPRPQNLNPHRTRRNLRNLARSRTALFPSQTRTCPKPTKNHNLGQDFVAVKS